MRIIADGYSDLIKGRDKIIELQKKYVDDWGDKIAALNIFFNKLYEEEDQEVLDRWQDANQTAEEEWQSKIKSNKTAISVVGGILLCGAVGSVLFTIASLQLDLGLTPALTLCCGFPTRVGVLGLFIATIVMGKRNRRLVKEGPKTTRKPDIWTREFPVSGWLDLERGWWRILCSSPIPIEYAHGDKGEEELVTRLANRLPDDHYCIKKLMVGKHLDADIVVVGPSGIWVLESKYINGTIRVRNGNWSKAKEYFGPGGVPKTEELEFENFEKQWLREKRAVQRAIKGILPDNICSNNEIIKGGLVFTHPKTRLDFDYSLNVEFRNADQWVDEICAAHENAILTDEQVLQLVDSLLNFSNMKGDSGSKSAVEVAEIAYKGQVMRLEHLLKDHDLIEMSPGEKRVRDNIRAFEEKQEQKELLWGS